MKSTFQGICFILAVIVMSIGSAVESYSATPLALTAPQEQASNLAVPPVAPPEPSSVIAVVQCNRLVALALIDVEATIHPISLEGLSSASAMHLMQLVPADRVISINTGCPGNPSKDTTVL